MLPHVMILDDDVCFARSAGELAKLEGFQPHLVHTVNAARDAARGQSMDLMLLDLELPDGSGLDLLPEIDLARHGRLAIVTGNPSIETAATAVSAPIGDYLVKPLDPQRLIAILRKASQLSRSAIEMPALPGVIAASEVMRAPIQLARRVAGSDASVFLAGQTGTGKEVFARAIHALSGRNGRFLAVNCGAMPVELLASQLFGHERGSFTGAIQRHAGIFEQAAHGTLFLDEISEMSPELQVYLLRVLETGSIRRIGADEETETPVRVIAASNRDPMEAVADGRLREDLYYRLADFTINLPALRARGEDVVLLARYFIDQFNARYGLRKHLCPGNVQRIRSHAWPGNVRELRSAVQRAYLLCPGEQISLDPGPMRATPPVETVDTITFTMGMPWSEFERRTLVKVLAYCAGDKTAAARMLGVSVRTIHNHVARLRRDDLHAASAA